jgi:DNA-binding HxlR family transcriptional regulator
VPSPLFPEHHETSTMARKKKNAPTATPDQPWFPEDWLLGSDGDMISPDGRTIARPSYDDGKFYLVDRATGDNLHEDPVPARDAIDLAATRPPTENSDKISTGLPTEDRDHTVTGVLNTQVDGGGIMKVDKAVAVALFQAMGRKTADKWTPTVLAGKLNALKDETRSDLRSALTDPGMEETLDEVLDALEKGETVEVEGEGEAPGKGRKKKAGKGSQPATAARGGKKPAGKAATAKAATTARKGGSPAVAEKRKRDKLGAFEGGGRFLIGRALSKKPQTMRELMEKAGVKRTYYDYLDRLADEGKVIRNGKTFALAN